jgi:hypothetical protein
MLNRKNAVSHPREWEWVDFVLTAMILFSVFGLVYEFMLR